jgi:hypothetical protein
LAKNGKLQRSTKVTLLDIAHERTCNTVPRSKRKALTVTKTDGLGWKRKKNINKGISKYTDII